MISRNSREAKDKKKDELNSFKSAKVMRVHDWGNGRISFNATFDNLVTIYGLTYIEGQRKDGSEYNFVTFPQQKGKDGNYYNYCYANIPNGSDLYKSIVGQIAEKLNE